MLSRLVLSTALAMAAAPAAAQPDALQSLLDDTRLGSHWIYDDLPRGVAEARRTGKPLLVLFRCVPCDCAAELDEAFVAPASTSIDLQQQFVCVRIVRMNNVDLQQFQFDRDLSLAVVFMHPDGTVYGRYGTRASTNRRLMTHISLASLEATVRRVLELHEQYPANRQQLAGKQGPAVTHRDAQQMPHMKPFPNQWVDCIHCHMVGEARLRHLRQNGQLAIRDIWPYPLPENIGLQMDIDHGLKVRSVRSDSPAHRAALAAGDELQMLDGQRLVSLADIQWVLHHAAAETKLPVQVLRRGELLELQLALAGDWKKGDLAWRDAMFGLRPGMKLVPISVSQKQKQGLAAHAMALSVLYPREQAAAAGIRSGDLLVEVDGRHDLLTEADVLAWFYADASRRQTDLVFLRGGERRAVRLPLK